MVDKSDITKKVIARAKNIRTSGQKLNLVARSIRGLNIKQEIGTENFL